ncbi:MAG: glycerol-3-phosphate 1-O-acyltransferase PlsY [Candidatus Gastranaerophilales bacterium]|nr:glycerol-3-phosphate 1-O-acyltransferase PlsY [Candidatus Gastranaerophilales bacterium]
MSVNVILFIVLAYLIGSIPTGFLIVKAKTGQDIRTIGSGSTGATNVKRVLGKKWFFIVMILDAIKGALPIVLARACHLADHLGIVETLCAVAVIIGHSKPIFLQFKGGKSVASGVGTILALNWIAGIIIALIWGTITYISKYVSLGSIIALGLSPFIMFFLKSPIGYVIYCAIAGVYIIYLHRENIKRLVKGEENKVRN